jgi:uncharacterized protein
MKPLAIVLSTLIIGACSANPQPAVAQVPAPGAEPVPTLHVSAHATVRRAPDVAVIQLAVETVATTAADATAQNTALMERVLRAVRDQGVADADIRTQRLELQPRYQDRRNVDPEIIGYRALNQVTVRLEDVTATGTVVDAAVRAGVNRVSGIHFELSNPEEAYHEALRQAITKARTEAEVVASALGQRLGAPLNVSTGGFNTPSPLFRAENMAVMDQQAGPPPVEPGEVEVQATVSIAWRLDT